MMVLSCVDSSRPRAGGNESNAHRLLRFQLTDGQTQCGAFEYTSLKTLTASIISPGSKLRILPGTRFVGGMLLLEPGGVDVLSAAAISGATAERY